MRRLLYLLLTTVFLGLMSLLPVSLSFGAGPDPTPTPAGRPEQERTVPAITDASISLSVRVPGGGTYRVGSWVPVTVTVRNVGADFAGDLRISSARGGPQYGLTLDLPRDSNKTVTVYVLANRFTRRMTVSLLRAGEQVLQQQVVVDPHQVNERLIAVVTGSQTALRVPSLLPDTNRLVATALLLTDLPDHFAGFSSFDAVVLEDVDLKTLTAQQLEALRIWLARGGQLIMSSGQDTERMLRSLPEDLRPVSAAVSDTIRAADLLNDTPDPEAQLTISRPTPAPGASSLGNVALAQTSGKTLLVDLAVGKGNVTFSGLRLSEPLLSVWERAPLFWNDLLNARPTVLPGFGPTDVSPEQMTEGSIASSLTRLPALELPSLTLLGLLLLTYVLSAGPVTYLILRRLDRQALGWVVVPVLTVIFAGIAYGVGYARRGGDVVINEIALIEPLGDGQARIRSFVGLFSPARQSYNVDLAGQQLLRPISIQGPWDTTEQSGVFAPEEASELDVPQWSMRAVMGDSVKPFAGVQATVTINGLELRGEVVNTTDQILRDVVLIQDVNVGSVGDLQPGEKKTITFGSKTQIDLANRRARFAGVPLSSLIYNDLIEKQQGPRGGQPLPPMIQLRQGLLDAIYANGPSQRNATPLLIAWVDKPSIIATVPDQKVARQQLAMITLEPTLEVAEPHVTLDQGWLQRGIEATDPAQSQVVCMGSKGLGLNLFGQTAVQTLTLPKTLRGLQAEEIKIFPSADGPWPQNILLELYDWQRGEWITQTLNGQQPLTLSEPTRFLSPSGGQIRARMSGQPNAQGGGCVYLDATISGELSRDA